MRLSLLLLCFQWQCKGLYCRTIQVWEAAEERTHVVQGNLLSFLFQPHCPLLKSHRISDRVENTNKKEVHAPITNRGETVQFRKYECYPYELTTILTVHNSSNSAIWRSFSDLGCHECFSLIHFSPFIYFFLFNSGWKKIVPRASTAGCLSFCSLYVSWQLNSFAHQQYCSASRTTE